MLKFVQGSLVIIALLLGCMVAGMFSRSARSQSPTIATAAPLLLPPVTSPGRYQFSVTNGSEEWIMDTQTGRAWERLGNNVASVWEEHTPDYSKASVVEGPK